MHVLIVLALTGILDQNLQCSDICIYKQLACSLAYLRPEGGDSVYVPGCSMYAAAVFCPSNDFFMCSYHSISLLL